MRNSGWVCFTIASLVLASGCDRTSAADQEREREGERAERAVESEVATGEERAITDRIQREAVEAAGQPAVEPAIDVPVDAPTAIAEMTPTEGNDVTAQVRFTQLEDGVLVHVTASHLAPGSTHGFHIHEHGDCSAADGTSAGGHYNPEGRPHGLPPDPNRHAGDMGNITADAHGDVDMSRPFSGFSLDGADPVIGRAVILHADPDDGSQPTGAAGARIACGVIRSSP